MTEDADDRLLVWQMAIPYAEYIAVFFVAFLVFVFFIRGNSKTKVEMHGYQVDFLQSFAAVNKFGHTGDALDAIVALAAADGKVQSEIFDEVQCIHCGSKNPAEWIASRKGDKTPYPLDLASPTVAFLGSKIVAKVEKIGEPPVKTIIADNERVDISKAARCCIDWAIVEFDALADGKPKGKGKKGK